MFSTKKTIVAALTIVGSCFATASFANGWKMMDEVAYNYPAKNNPTTKKWADTLWAKELPKIGKDGTFILIGSVKDNSKNYIITMMDSHVMGCEDAPNGNGTSAEIPMYSKCPIRVFTIDNQTSKQSVKQLPNFCYLNLNESPKDLKENHTEYMFDPKSKKIYLKTIMYGKHAKECDNVTDVE